MRERWSQGHAAARRKWRIPDQPQGQLEAVLVSLRDPGDPMAEHELMCFELATGLSEIRVVHAASRVPGPEELDADLLLFGGSGAYSVLDSHQWVQRLLDFLLEVVDLGVPAWGSCFGYQGLALAMGGSVVFDNQRARMGGFEVLLAEGAHQDPLFRHLPYGFHAQFGHHDHVVELPHGVSLLATDPHGRFEAFRVDGSLFWAAQFHPELTSELTLSRFHHYRDHYAHDQAEAVEAAITGGEDRGEAQAVLPALVKLARRVRRERKGG